MLNCYHAYVCLQQDGKVSYIVG